MSKILIKLGGSSLHDPKTLKELIKLVKEFRRYHEVILVHGGGPAINQELTARGISWKFINGQRQTTPEMMDVIEEVLAVKVNGMLTQILTAAGVPAVGISGARLLACSPSNAELMQVGKIESVNTELLENMFDTPVIAPIGQGAGGEKYNINADWAAACIAIAVKAEKLIFLTDQKGILNQDKEPMTFATPELIHEMIKLGIISGGMQTKVLTMIHAINSGVKEVKVMSAMEATDESQGTILTTQPASNETEDEWKQLQN